MFFFVFLVSRYSPSIKTFVNINQVRADSLNNLYWGIIYIKEFVKRKSFESGLESQRTWILKSPKLKFYYNWWQFPSQINKGNPYMHEVVYCKYHQIVWRKLKQLNCEYVEPSVGYIYIMISVCMICICTNGHNPVNQNNFKRLFLWTLSKCSCSVFSRSSHNVLSEHPLNVHVLTGRAP